MSSLPAEVDFTANSAATSARMDEAMAFLVAWLRRVESVQPEFLAVTEQLKAIGLERLDAVLSPIFVDAQDISAQLAAIRAAWLTGAPLNQLLTDLAAQVTARLAAVDGKLSGVDAQIAANHASVTAQLGANATSVANQLTAQNTAVDTKLGAFSPTAKWAEASPAEARAGTASRLISAAVLWAMQAPVPLVDAPTIALDLSSGGQNYAVTIGANRVLGNPTGGRAGQQGSIFVTQDAAGGRVLSYGANYVPDDLATYPQINLGAGAVTELRFKVAPDGKVRIYGGKPAATYAVPQYISQLYYGQSFRQDALNTDQNMYETTIYAPVEIKTPVTIDALVGYCTSSGGYSRMAIYTMVAGKPGVMLRQTGTFSGANVQVAPLTSPITLAPGVYMLALASGGGNFYVLNANAVQDIVNLGIGLTGVNRFFNTNAAWQTSTSFRNQYASGFVDNPTVSPFSQFPAMFFRVQ